MRLLVDTHCWLWFLLAPEKLNDAGRAALADPESLVYFSVASSWEIVVKFALGKLDLPEPPSRYIPKRLEALGNESLPITQSHALLLESLPQHHKDPFDRMIVAQACVEGLTLVTADRALGAYDLPILWAG